MAAIEKIKIGSTTYDLAASKLPKLGVNPLTNLVGASAADTVANWVTVGTGIGVISTADRALITDFPISYSSWVLNLVFDSTAVYQIIYPYVQNGTIFHRAGGSNGWYETGWVKEFNSENIIPIANGGTGASTAATARDNLGITSLLADKQDKITGAASTIASSDFSNTDAVLISNSSGKVSSSSGVTTTQLKTLQGINSNIQDQLDAKVETSKHRMNIYRSVADIGMEASSTFADVVAAVPNYTTIYLNASGMSDASWNLPTSYGIIQITRRENTQLFIAFWNRIGNAYFATTSSDGVPTGVWNKVIEQNDLDSALEGKQDTITGAASSIVSSDFSNTDAVLVSNSNGKVSSASGVTKTELQTLQGVTRNLATTMTNLGSNIIDTSTNDTPAKWSELGSGYAYFSATGRLVNQPTQYGIVVSNVVGAMVFQFFAANSGTGSVYVRYGNSSGWRYNWSKLIDDRKFEFDATTATLNITL